MLKIKYLSISLLLFIVSCTPPPAVEPQQSWAEQTLQELTLREKIAQMLIYRMNLQYRNSENAEWQEIMELIESDGIGGIHLWNGNAALSVTMLNDLQKRSKVPIIVDMDIERGLKQRFPEGTDLPPAMAIGASNYLSNAYKVGRITAKEARSVGVHWNLAPVVDVNNNPENPIINVRSFSDDPKMVTDFAIAYIKGLQDGGMLATAKHFPGHGDTHTDSHLSLSEIPSDSSRLWSVELAPYQAVIDAGVDAVMISHLIAPDYQLDSYVPATLSEFWIQTILRNKLGFEGLVVTDAFDMGSITNNFSDAYALVNAVNAGCDVIIQNDNYRYAIDTIEEAVKNGIISEERVDKSALRMLKLKEKVGLHRNNLVNFEDIRENVGSYNSRMTAQKIANQSIVIVKNENSLIPIKSYKDSITVIDIYDTPYNHKQSIATKELIKSRLPIQSYAVDKTDSQEHIKLISDSLTNESRVVLNIFSKASSFKGTIKLNSTQSEFIKNILFRTKNVIMVSYGNPYLINDFPEIPAYICAWEDQTYLQMAGANAVIGKGNFTGKMPIQINRVIERGDGLSLKSSFAPPKSDWKPPAITVKRVLANEIGVSSTALSEMLNNAVADSAFPGGVLLAAKDGNIFFEEAFGFNTYSKIEQIQTGSIFDLASLTKVVATTSAIMMLYDQGKLNLEDRVADFIPEFIAEELPDNELRKRVSIRHLLTHTSGLKPFELFYEMEDKSEIFNRIYSSPLLFQPGEKCIYSDIGFMLLGEVVERISGLSLDQFVEDKVFLPLGMHDTYFNPDKTKLKRIVPTEFSSEENDYIKGHVHDENAYAMGGVSGHAGLFSTAHDLSIFCQMLLNNGSYDKLELYNKNTISTFTTGIDSVASERYLGWESPSGKSSGGVSLSSNSFGHTGFTGTSLWLDPEYDIFVILLTNAVHPFREWKKPKYYDWRQRIHSAVYESLGFTDENPKLEWRKEW